MIDFTGLRKRPTFEGFVDYLANRQETIRYPDRFAKQIREHPYLTQLDGEGFLEVEEMDRKKAEEDYRERLARQLANQNNVSAQVARAVANPPGPMRDPGPQDKPSRAKGSQAPGSMSRPGLQAYDETDSSFSTLGSKPFQDYMQRTVNQLQPVQNDMDLDSWYDDEFAKRKAEDKQREREKQARIKEQVARNLGQPSASIGVIPYIANISTPVSMSDAESEQSVRSRSPKKGNMLLQDQGQASSSSGVRRPSDTQGDSPVRAKSKAEPKAKPKALATLTAPQEEVPASTAKASKVLKKDTVIKKKPQHGTQKDDSTDPEYYLNKNKAYIINQINLRGYRGSQQKIGRMTKPKLVDALLYAISNPGQWKFT